MYFHGDSVKVGGTCRGATSSSSSAWPGSEAGSVHTIEKFWARIRLEDLKGKSTREDGKLEKNQWDRRE